MTALDTNGGRYLIKDAMGTLLLSVVFFAVAGAVPQAWIILALTLGCFVVKAVVLTRIAPEILNHRGIRPKDVPWWDKHFLVLFTLLAIASPITCGVDAGRFGMAVTCAGVALYLFGYTIAHWAMSENRFFEMTVRIQDDRGHEVVSTGPYAIVRHPGYTGAILSMAALPLIAGSLYGVAVAALMALLFVLRTALEDRMLRRELRGYREFSATVRYRLIPYVW